VDKYQQLEKLAELKSKGALSEEEFSAQKEKILAADISAPSEPEKKAGTYWPPGFSLGFGLFCCLMLSDTSTGWDKDGALSLIMFSLVALVLGIVSESIQTKGRGMAIAGIILGTIGSLFGLAFLILCSLSEDGSISWLS